MLDGASDGSRSVKTSCRRESLDRGSRPAHTPMQKGLHPRQSPTLLNLYGWKQKVPALGWVVAPSRIHIPYGELAPSKAPDLARMGKTGTGNYVVPYSPPRSSSILSCGCTPILITEDLQ